MKKPLIKAIRLLAFLTLCCTIMVGSNLCFSSVAEAATKKASVSATKMTIPIGKIDSKICWNTNIYEVTNAQKLSVNDKLKGAIYKFTSSDTKVVKISADGGYLTGIKAGSATITCTQTYQKKSTVIGKCKVTVKSAHLAVDTDINNVFLNIGNTEYDLFYYYVGYEPLYSIEYRNPDAKYSFNSSSKDFIIKEVKIDASKAKDIPEFPQEELERYIGDRYLYGYQLTAKAAGTYTITVKETYNNKTRTLGTFTIEVKATQIDMPEITLYLGEYWYRESLLRYPRYDIDYYYEIEDYDEVNVENNILTWDTKDGFTILYANKPGAAKVNIYENSKEGKLVGTAVINVKELPVKNIIVSSNELTTYAGDIYFYIDYKLEPNRTTDKVTLVSDNPEVLMVEYIPDIDFWNCRPLESGEANVTIICGDKSVVIKVVVK